MINAINHYANSKRQSKRHCMGVVLTFNVLATQKETFQLLWLKIIDFYKIAFTKQ